MCLCDLGEEGQHGEEDDDYWEDDEEFYRFQSTELDEDLHNTSLDSFDDTSFHRYAFARMFVITHST